MDHVMLVTVRHWLPILTFCPVNNLPDLVYVSVSFNNEFKELYEVRQKVREIIGFRKEFMETLAIDIMEEFPTATKVELRLLFDRHHITITRIDKNVPIV